VSGNCAALIVIDGETHAEAIIGRPVRCPVLKDGRIVARGGAARLLPAYPCGVPRADVPRAIVRSLVGQR